MINSLYMRDLLSLQDISPRELELILRVAADIKAAQKEGRELNYLAGKQIAVILQKDSLRTRVSFEVGISRLGGNCVLLTGKDSAFSRGEPVIDTAGVLDGYVDAIVLRTFADSLITELANYANVPVFNALTDAHHPFQGLADLLTIKEHFGSFEGLKMSYFGDGANNMAHTYLLAGALAGMNTCIASPSSATPNPAIFAAAQNIAQGAGATLSHETDPKVAAAEADIIITDTFTSMGQEDEHDTRLAQFIDYQVNEALMQHASDRAVFMHCLPAHRGEEVSAEVIDSAYSLIYPQAHNRQYVQQAVLALALVERL